MEFIQIIDMHTSKVDEIMRLEDEWEKATKGKRTLRRSIVTRDRNDAERYLVIAFFDSYESAMANSNLLRPTSSVRSRARSSTARCTSVIST